MGGSLAQKQNHFCIFQIGIYSHEYIPIEYVGMTASEPDEDDLDKYPEVYLDINLEECDEEDVEAEDKEAAEAREAIVKQGGANAAEEQPSTTTAVRI